MPQTHTRDECTGQPRARLLPTFNRERVYVDAIPAVALQDGCLVVVGDACSTSVREYTSLKTVGDGSFGTVELCDWHGPLPPNTPFPAMQRNAGARPEYAGRRLVAVKRMKHHQSSWNECESPKELQALRALPSHPSIVSLYDFFWRSDTKELFLVFEPMEGNLYQLMRSRRSRPFAGGLVASIFQQVISGIDHIHMAGYFHRDLKPENLLVTTTGLSGYSTLDPSARAGKDVVVIVKVADFGLTRKTTSAPPYTDYVAMRWYRAPEVILRAPTHSSAVDLWAFGVIMAEVVELRPLFPGTDEMDQVLRICQLLGNPSDAYGEDHRGLPLGGGRWDDGVRLAASLGLTFPPNAPLNFFKHFSPAVPIRLVECIFDLLRYDPAMRLTARQCMEHSYLRDAAQVGGPVPLPTKLEFNEDPSPIVSPYPPPVPPFMAFSRRPTLPCPTIQARGPSTKPPRLAVPLLLSSLLSTSTMALYMIANPTVSSLPISSTLVAVYSIYYLVRYTQRCIVIRREVLAGGDGWPTVQLFPGKLEYAAHPTLAFLSLILSLGFSRDVLRQQSVVDLRWPEDTLSIALATAYGLGLVVHVAVLFQARRISWAEDSMKCAEAHAMRCDKCLVKQDELDKPGQSDHLPLRLTRALGLAVVLTAVLLYTMHALLSTYGPRISSAFAALPVFALLHSTYFFFRIQNAAHRQAANTFATPGVPGKRWERRMFVLSHFVFFVVYSFGALFALTDERARAAPVPLLCTVALAVVHHVAGFEADRAEARAVCEREGHHWKCMRWCTVVQVQEKQGKYMGVLEEITSRTR